MASTVYITLLNVDPTVSPVQMAIVVHELLCVELWKEKVFPLMLDSSHQPTSGFPAYLVVRLFPCEPRTHGT